MNEREFYGVCYDRYRHEQNQTDAIYQRAGILLVSLPILGAVAYKLGEPELLAQTFTWKLFFYMLGAGSAFTCLAASVVFLFLGILPRSYESLPPMKVWKDWRDDFRRRLSESKSGPDEERIGNEFITQIIPKIVDAEHDYCKKNERRRRHFRSSILWAAGALGGIGIEAFFHMLLHS